ncbi:MAG TPA: fumarylacetoacetate hydrolase family protein [Chitinophagaceae bacterium]|nr:fumarylacetoacetate hydrolase family protein [Chitinophagaceae bacterium]
MHLYKTRKGNMLAYDLGHYVIGMDWDTLINRDDLHRYILGSLGAMKKISKDDFDLATTKDVSAPIGTQEVWAAGVTYLRSRNARMEEAQDTGGADCYQKVYEAERPELFFKSVAHRVAADREEVYIRNDSSWNVPEPELTLYINSKGTIQAYTIGNDMSSRSIEGENPLYLPQAKVYERSAALGPCLYIPPKPISLETMIHLEIHRGDKMMFKDSTPVSRMKRSLTELAAYLFRECDFPVGCFLMTGTCLVPPNDFTLQKKDRVEIRIEGIGTLTNTVSGKP